MAPPRQHSDRPSSGSFNALPLVLLLAAIAVVIPFLFFSREKPGESSDKPGDAVIAWRTDIDAALADAKATGKPLFVDFTADWCPPCKVMKREVFSKADVKTHIESKFIPVRLDMTERNENTGALGFRFRIKYLPTMLVLDVDGNELRRESGGMGADELIQWLDAPGK